MARNYTPLAQSAQRLIQKYGRSITQRVPTFTAGARAYEGTVTYVNYTLTAVVVDYRADEADGETILQTDRKYLVAARDVTVAPAPGHLLVDGSATLTVVGVATVQPGATALVYECQARVGAGQTIGA